MIEFCFAPTRLATSSKARAKLARLWRRLPRR